jgi:sugar phosphate isomerase/epimerase
MPVGLGAVNCKRAVQSLKVAGYDGAITLENLCNDPVVQYGYLDMSRKMVAEPWGKD